MNGMLNGKTVNVKMKRIELCDLILATTSIKRDMIHEFNDCNTTETRKEVLERSIKKWEKLHDMLNAQLNEFDARHVEGI